MCRFRQIHDFDVSSYPVKSELYFLKSMFWNKEKSDACGLKTTFLTKPLIIILLLEPETFTQVSAIKLLLLGDSNTWSYDRFIHTMRATPLTWLSCIHTSVHITFSTWWLSELCMLHLWLSNRDIRGQYLIEAKWRMATSRAWTESRGTCSRPLTRVSCSRRHDTLASQRMDTLKIRSLPSPGIVTSKSTWSGRGQKEQRSRRRQQNEDKDIDQKLKKEIDIEFGCFNAYKYVHMSY